MATNFQPPPTYAMPILEDIDPSTGQKGTKFNPVWLKWFYDLTGVISNSGGGTTNPGGGPGTVSPSLPTGQIGFGSATNTLTGDADFGWNTAAQSLRMGTLGTAANIRGTDASGTGAFAGSVSIESADTSATDAGGSVSIAGGDAKATVAEVGGNVTLLGGSSTGAAAGGSVILAAGAGTPNGDIVLSGLPTVAPATSGALWRDAGAGNVVKCVP